MKRDQLEKGNKLKKEIDELKDFAQYIQDCKEGTFVIRKPKFLFKYKTWVGKENTFKLNERLAFRMLLEVDKELEDLQKQFENL
ncbi:hypothetical protein LPC27_16955 [Paraclostridium bifermentans]|uniref:hypothetical protein n=1 Tax=Paraclostridium bifermentans TaxID=1490 RepID=UPI001F196864|nr:hypothetical protein [Paraclostridium bifermentans]MCE9677473.1 hypothetical protein [Paraclostridium bifermentans]